MTAKNRLCAFCFAAVTMLFFILSFNARALFRPQNRDSVYTHVETEIKVVALTFDDGPHPRYTPRILDILDSYGVKATFFQIGKNIENYTDVARAVYDAGHEIGNHTYSHPNMRGMSPAKIAEEFERNDELIRSFAGNIPNILRTPQGVDGDTIERVVKRNEKNLILWTIDTLDWKGRDSDSIAKFVVENVAPGDIILFHDYVSCRNTTLPALEKIIPRLIEQGYSFATVSELIEIYG